MSQGSVMTELMGAARGFKSMADLKDVIDRIKHAKIVMLGEASHGTQEFYEWRRLISQKLIADHGFSFIGVEGDWPPTQRVNHFIGAETESDSHPEAKQDESGRDVLRSFKRWPTWMWANTEVVELVEWLRAWNKSVSGSKRVGFHGLDVYSLFESIEATVIELERVDPVLAQNARLRYQCFDPFVDDEKEYARSLMSHPQGCREGVIKILMELLRKRLGSNAEPGKRAALWNATQNARIVKNAEDYYRAMLDVDESSWNVRDRHMMETIDVLLNYYGPEAKGIVWAHNTHIGDYRATSMLERNTVNIGGLAREKYGSEQIALVGFSTYEGTVIASHYWGGETAALAMPKARTGSWDSVLHSVALKMNADNVALVFAKQHQEGTLGKTRKGQRAIGVVYNPAFERWGNYVPTSLAQRYDVLLFIDKTSALEPLDVKVDPKEIEESYPFGV